LLHNSLRRPCHFYITSLKLVHILHGIHAVRLVHSLHDIHAMRLVHSLHDIHAVRLVHSLHGIHAVRLVQSLHDIHAVRLVRCLHGIHAVRLVHSLHCISHSIHDILPGHMNLRSILPSSDCGSHLDELRGDCLADIRRIYSRKLLKDCTCNVKVKFLFNCNIRKQSLFNN